MTEDDIKKSLSRVRKLRNRYNRYWKKLIGEALKFGLERGVEIYVIEPDSSIPVGDEKIAICVNENGEIVDDSGLSSLVRREFPSLWRRYHKTTKEYREELDCLRRLYYNYINPTSSVP